MLQKQPQQNKKPKTNTTVNNNNNTKKTTTKIQWYFANIYTSSDLQNERMSLMIGQKLYVY
jgi:hypothetical protein